MSDTEDLPDYVLWGDKVEKSPKRLISSFKDLMNELSYSWSYPEYDLEKLKDGTFLLNKLHITPIQASYKMESWGITPEVFAQLEKLYFLLNDQSQKEP